VLSSPTTLKYLTTIIDSKVKRDIGFAATNLHADVLALVEKEMGVRPEFREEQMLKLQNGLYNYFNEDEE
jgi:hypothetical protein